MTWHLMLVLCAAVFVLEVCVICLLDALERRFSELEVALQRHLAQGSKFDRTKPREEPREELK